jgi:hypothetical protein
VPATETLPRWINHPNKVHPELVFIVGTCLDQPSIEEARRCAVADAYRQMMDVYRVKGGLTQAQHFTSGQPRWISRGQVNTLSVVYSAWILIGYPRAQIPQLSSQRSF